MADTLREGIVMKPKQQARITFALRVLSVIAILLKRGLKDALTSSKKDYQALAAHDATVQRWR